MAQTDRMLQAARALSQALTLNSIRHAFHGSILLAMKSNAPLCDEILCIVEGGSTHPFRRVRQAVAENPELAATNSSWTNRLVVTYHACTPSISIEILPAGEEGPRYLDESTTVAINGLPFLTVSEFLRAKMKAWAIRSLDHDAKDILFMLPRYWESIDLNRIPEQEMERFVATYPSALSAWASIKKRYGS